MVILVMVTLLSKISRHLIFLEVSMSNMNQDYRFTSVPSAAKVSGKQVEKVLGTGILNIVSVLASPNMHPN